MKKIFRILALAVCLFMIATGCIFLAGCEQKQDVTKNITELRTGVYLGQSDTHTLSAFYGYRESPYKHNGSSGDKIYGLTFKLKDKNTTASTQIAYSLSFTYNEKQYKDDFFYSPNSNVLTVFFEIDNFTPATFDVVLSYSDKNDTITMANAVPEGTASINKALDNLFVSQKQIIDSYRDANGKFTGEIHARLLVKDDKAFWYVDVSDTDSKTQAFLIDGKTCEVLAVRRIL